MPRVTFGVLGHEAFRSESDKCALHTRTLPAPAVPVFLGWPSEKNRENRLVASAHGLWIGGITEESEWLAVPTDGGRRQTTNTGNARDGNDGEVG